MHAVRIIFVGVLWLVAVPQAFAGGKTEAGRFRIHFAGANGAELDWAAGVFRDADENLTPLFGDVAPVVIDVTLSRSDAEWQDDAGEHAAWAAGLVAGQEVFVNLPSNLGQLPQFPSTVRHEAVHAMLGPSFSRNAPRWVVEGIAEHYSTSKRIFSPLAFENDDEISRALVGKDRTRRRAAYGAAHERFGRLVADCGENAVLTWVKALRLDRGAVVGGVEGPCVSNALPTPALVARQASPPASREIKASLFWSRGKSPTNPIDLTAKGIIPRTAHAPAPECGPYDFREWPGMTVVVGIVVNAEGNVVAMSSGVDPCDRKVAAAVQEWRFEPVLVDGRPVAWVRNLTLSFNPDSPKPVKSTATWD